MTPFVVALITHIPSSRDVHNSARQVTGGEGREILISYLNASDKTNGSIFAEGKLQVVRGVSLSIIFGHGAQETTLVISNYVLVVLYAHFHCLVCVHLEPAQKLPAFVASNHIVRFRPSSPSSNSPS